MRFPGLCLVLTLFVCVFTPSLCQTIPQPTSVDKNVDSPFYPSDGSAIETGPKDTHEDLIGTPPPPPKGPTDPPNLYPYSAPVSEPGPGQPPGSGVCSLGITCGEASGVDIKIPILGLPGPPGKPGFRGLDGLPGNKECQVAFYVALLTKTLEKVPSDLAMLYDKVVTNQGDAYDRLTGQFVVPYDGTYIFNLNVAAVEGKKAAVCFTVNTTWHGTVRADSTRGWGSASNSYTLHLKKGDKVLTSLQRDAPHVYGDLYTSFSGRCLWKDD